MSHTYSTGNNVCFNNECCTIFKLRTFENKPAYLIREINSGLVHDNVLETSLMNCSINEIIDNKWSTFVYTGDNGAASAWIFDNIIKNIASATGLNWGSNADNTVYTFSASGQTWTKNKSA